MMAVFSAACILLLLGAVLPSRAVHSVPWTKLEKAEYKADVEEPQQKWNYVNVRPHAHMFWWVYYMMFQPEVSSKPLVIWLQGGPGASSTGVGNFMEIGPRDVSLSPRQTTWLSAASILFVDNPVGTGFSYVTDPSAYNTDNAQIAEDLLILLTSFMKELPEFQTSPLYIFGGSYAGKMVASFSQLLHKPMQASECLPIETVPMTSTLPWKMEIQYLLTLQAVTKKRIKCNLKGVAMGDAWISPLDSIMTWGPYLYSTSLVDEHGRNQINAVGMDIESAMASGEYKKATSLMKKMKEVIGNVTGGVNTHNILHWEHHGNTELQGTVYVDQLVPPILTDELTALMNGPIRRKLGMIPTNVTWEVKSEAVFSAVEGDFMKDVIDVVDDLVTNTDLQVVVYTGQLDVIADILGAERWVQKLKWPGLEKYNNAHRHQMKLGHEPVAFIKRHKNFSFYWMLDAGHMVPIDAPESAFLMLQQILAQ